MSNLGLRRAMAEHDIRLIETRVGDRYVLEELTADGLSLGGEQSGHVIMTKFATTGDGILTACTSRPRSRAADAHSATSPPR